jgi:uncharacterized protein
MMISEIGRDLQPTLTQIVIYPIKSLDGKIVDRSSISAGGALAFDRRWAIVDDKGKVVNAKRTAKTQQLRSQFDLVDTGLERQLVISIHTADNPTIQTFSLTTERPELARWLSQFFGFPVHLIENAVGGFPDDLNAYGPTIISTSTLETVCTWFPDLDLAEVRRRFRTNLELSGIPAFWEDRLFDAPGKVVDFQLGNVQFQGINPCQRCIVPTRDALTGNITPNFQQIFQQQRQQTLLTKVSGWMGFMRFNHFYRFTTSKAHRCATKLSWLNTLVLIIPR